MIPHQPRDPRESALGFQVSVVLAESCQVAGVLFASPERRTLTGLLGALWVVFTVIRYIVGTVWLRRCWANAELLAPGGLPFSRRWATAGWLVPLLNVWMRWRILLALWRTSGVRDSLLLVHVWWGTTLAVIAAWFVTRGPSLPRAVVLGGAVLVLLRTVFTVLIVRRITACQVEALPAAPEPVAA